MNDAEYFKSAAGSASSMAGIMEMTVVLGAFRACKGEKHLWGTGTGTGRLRNISVELKLYLTVAVIPVCH